MKNKVVPLYPSPEAGERCPVYILDRYISKLPSEARKKDLFYVRPLDNITSDPNRPWYSSVPLGKHTLQSKFKNMCSEAEISGNKTNHSLRATAATEMFRHGVPEKFIQERIGHRSLEALRSYERLDEVQHKAVSTLLSNAPEKSHSMTCSQRLLSTKTNSFSMPSTSYGPPLQAVTLQDLHGCTINFNCAPPPALATPQLSLQDTTYAETELSEHFNI